MVCSLVGMIFMAAAELPMGLAPEAVAVPHFPDRLHAYVWRNWQVVPIERLADVVGATPDDIVRIGKAMELSGPPNITKAAEALSKSGAKAVYACATHGVLSGSAVEKIEGSVLKEVIITNSIAWNGQSKKIKVLSVAPILGEAIKRIHQGDSVSSLFI